MTNPIASTSRPPAIHPHRHRTSSHSHPHTPNAVSRSYRPRPPSPASSPSPPPQFRTGTPNAPSEKRRSFVSRPSPVTGHVNHPDAQLGSDGGRPVWRKSDAGNSTQGGDLSGWAGVGDSTFDSTEDERAVGGENVDGLDKRGRQVPRTTTTTTTRSDRGIATNHGNANHPTPTTHQPQSQSRKPARSPLPLLPIRLTFPLPLRIPSFTPQGRSTTWEVLLTRQKCESGLILGTCAGLIGRLVGMGEGQVAFELGVIVTLTIIYLLFRSTSLPNPNSQLSSLPALTRPKRPSIPPPVPLQDPPGTQAFIWATESRDYRECEDDGSIWALLLGPVLSGAMFYETCRRLRDGVEGNGWDIEGPLVSPSTPRFRTLGREASLGGWGREEEKALWALALSRRQLCHMTCLSSLLLLGHILWSRRRELHLHAQSGERERERGEDSDPLREKIQPWGKRSEWRRTYAVGGLSFVLTGGFVGLKIGAMCLGLVGDYDFTYSDLIISTLFFQFSLYVCVRLARRGFTMGELGVICHAGTGLFMETVNLTRIKISIFKTPFVRTYRLPTPLLIFQLALIPGSFLCGFLLSPLLVLSRRIAQRPVHRLRYPEEKQLYRKGLAAGFYLGSALICGGGIGSWVKWCLGGRDPVIWVIMWLMEGGQWYSRPLLIAYWGLMALISVAGWTRQLTRSRKKRSWTQAQVDKGQHKVKIVSNVSSGTGTDLPARTPSPLTMEGKTQGTGLGERASQVMDGVDQRLPVFSVNARRKFFHALAVVMFVPGIIIDPAFTHLSFSLAFAIFNFFEYIRYFALYPFGAAVHLFLNEFLDKKDSGTAILSHFYLLTGCAGGVWLDSPKAILSLLGVVALGIGDALASIVGKRMGRRRWSSLTGKTVEGSFAFFSSVFLTGIGLRLTGMIESFSLWRYAILSLCMSLMEAWSEQNDNLTLPVWGWCLGIILDV